MDDRPVDNLNFYQLRDELHQCPPTHALRHDLRRECLRRAERWGAVANYSGLVMLGIIAVCTLVTIIHG
jgi:hypothetical protein